MLKRKLVRAGFYGNGLLFLVPTGASLKGEPFKPYAAKEITVKKQQMLASVCSDTTIVYQPDSVTVAKETISPPQVKLNKYASRFVKDFIKKENESLERVKNKSPKYFDIIDPILERYDVPLQLKYLAVIESELDPKARSRVGAVGAWQLMPTTARELGLKVSKKYDERKLYYKSTTAAAKYLKALYNEYGDWLLVIAAYNSGPGTVNKAIKRSGSKNFWALQNFLPKETRLHVKRFVGTHYYFEGTGSVATLTKNEAIAFQKILEGYNNTQTAEVKNNDQKDVAITIENK